MQRIHTPGFDRTGVACGIAHVGVGGFHRAHQALAIDPNNPDALASLRAPIFEDKVIDFILELAQITDKTVSKEELFKEDEA